MGAALELNAFAKLNLGLRVLGRRADGFHDLHTHLQAIDLADTVRWTLAEAGTGVRLTCDSPLNVPPEDNLAGRAARLFQAHTGVPLDASCRLTKRIPAGAGLGGGSSDAAATLVALDRLCGTGLSPAALAALGARLGSDVPFFVRGGFACARGRGERLAHTPSPHVGVHFVLLLPPVHADTPAVYRAWDALGQVRGDRACARLGTGNDLEAAACRRYPALAPYAALVRGADTSIKGMSGSGSAFYAGFARAEAADACRRAWAASAPQARLMRVRAVAP